MKRVSIFLLAVTAFTAVPAAAQGQLTTIERGYYACELPGDASGAVGVPQPELSFTIESASRYSSPQGDGTYLRRGTRLTMTSGPRNGDAYEVVGRGFLRKIEDGVVGRLRCVRSGR